MKLRLDKLGRVVLPKPLRARYGLRPGTELEVSEGAQEFALRPAVPEGEVDFAKVIREDREERLRRLGGMEGSFSLTPPCWWRQPLSIIVIMPLDLPLIAR